jgi:4-aminobutyrate aminotransferase-like enzyme
VLDAIQADKLQAHAAEVGAALLAGFARLAESHACVGSARGVGLMVGLEILHPLTPQQKADAGCPLRLPWPAAASAVVYAMKDRGFLL